MVLIGESLGDPDMLKGLPDTDNVIKIGFLNHNVRSHHQQSGCDDGHCIGKGGGILKQRNALRYGRLSDFFIGQFA